ncbi:septation ring formation regulator EzrA [Jeotgalibacillus haloalkalitolerans]|uniref:Septation ring formation regulator EzrA n=1 Tax=Jeotgalibacillus haloalkalitolerans TaxID=3104292 RepID=A0ABU5KMW4_9BACL|nr:septation ring formation regulator EzrA [Jeotgalibacillus sp. HH7-29]MDZ5712484.1 septation ring formation regulator EzrA [Jeotgalibacillus sp. HH7-29]
MEYIIGSVLLIIIFIITAFVLRKKQYKEVDKLEEQKLDIQHRPVLEEMTKVKQLNMNGQTEELFEKWRDSWNNIVDKQLAEVDSMLFDAEEYIDKFRFAKSRKVREEIAVELNKAEEHMNEILAELEELMGSDEKNREEIQVVETDHKEASSLVRNRRSQFSKTAEPIERKIQALEPKLDEYHRLTEEGNYLQAREIVIYLTAEMNEISMMIEAAPDLADDLLDELPKDLSDLKEACKEMNEQKYPIHHLNLEELCLDLDNRLKEAEKHLIRLEFVEAEEIRVAAKKEIDQAFTALEEEVHARTELPARIESVKKLLGAVKDRNKELIREMDYVRQGYQLDQHDLDLPKEKEEQLEELSREFEHQNKQIEKQLEPYSSVLTEVKKVETQLTLIDGEHKKYAAELEQLRSDELSAREQQEYQIKAVRDQEKTVDSANLPKIPEFWFLERKDIIRQIEALDSYLAERPMNMKAINQHTMTTEKMIETFTENTEEMIQAAEQAEKVIQYGNRYRSRHETVFIGLNEAELMFRNGDYQNALEQAAESIEKIEPGALKKIDAL